MSRTKLMQKLKELKDCPQFSASSLLNIGIGGNRVAGLPNKKNQNTQAFGRKGRSMQPTRT